MTPIEPLLLWKDVRRVSKDFKRFVLNKKPTGRGCSFVKIGHMLEDLKVIPYANLDERTHLDRNIEKLSPEFKPIFRQYATMLIVRGKRQISTATNAAHILRYLEQWLKKHYPGINIVDINEKIISEYLAGLKSTVRDSHRGRNGLFFRWCLYEGITTQNPLQHIKSVDLPKELPICSKEELQKLIRFIKNPANDPYEAFMLALILFWGFSRGELVYSTMALKDDAIEIQPYQRPCSYAHKRPTRKKALLLPKSPAWFLELQKRFLADWNHRFSKLKNPGPNKPVFLCPDDQHNRPMSPSTASRLLNNVTLAAVGKSIPMRVLRITAGHLHTVQADASILADLGWCPKYAFNYTWMPRKYWSAPSSIKA